MHVLGFIITSTEYATLTGKLTEYCTVLYRTPYRAIVTIPLMFFHPNVILRITLPS